MNSSSSDQILILFLALVITGGIVGKIPLETHALNAPVLTDDELATQSIARGLLKDINELFRRNFHPVCRYRG